MTLTSMPDLTSSPTPMKFSAAIDAYISDMRQAGRLNSDGSEYGYRRCLEQHGEDVQNRDPAKTGREDVKKTLERWPHPNTQGKNRSMLIAFYDWMMEEGLRASNPARMTRRPKKRPTSVYRLTREEAASMLHAAQGSLERRAIYLGLCAGLRSAELRNLRRWHLDRDGLVHVSADIAKGGRERWVPVLEELEPVIEEIRASTPSEQFVLVPTRPMAATSFRRLVAHIAINAGIQAHVYPHLLRHAYGDFIARQTGILVAREMLGHANVSTTENYVGRPSLEKLALSVRGLRYQDENTPETGIAERKELEGRLSSSALESQVWASSDSIDPNLDGEAIQ